MKLSVHIIKDGRVIAAGDEIPDAEVPSFAAKYAVGEADANGSARATGGKYQRRLRRERANMETRAYEPAPEEWSPDEPEPAPARVKATAPKPNQKYVRRGPGWKRIETQELVMNEPIYRPTATCL
jgi:hypothetical protein